MTSEPTEKVCSVTVTSRH